MIYSINKFRHYLLGKKFTFHVVGFVRDYVGETRRDHRGLEPKSKRERGKRENRLRATGDTQGHGPPTQKTRIDADTKRHKRTSICINKMTNKKLQPTMGRGSVTTEQAGEQMPMPVRYNTDRRYRMEVLPEAHGHSTEQREPP